MKLGNIISFLGAFIFLMAFTTFLYCYFTNHTWGIFALPFLFFIMLVPYGMGDLD